MLRSASTLCSSADVTRPTPNCSTPAPPPTSDGPARRVLTTWAKNVDDVLSPLTLVLGLEDLSKNRLEKSHRGTLRQRRTLGVRGDDILPE